MVAEWILQTRFSITVKWNSTQFGTSPKNRFSWLKVVTFLVWRNCLLRLKSHQNCTWRILMIIMERLSIETLKLRINRYLPSSTWICHFLWTDMREENIRRAIRNNTTIKERNTLREKETMLMCCYTYHVFSDVRHQCTAVMLPGQ